MPQSTGDTYHHVHASHAFIDTVMAHMRRVSERPITCRAGCYHCCREPAYAEKSEVQALIAALPDDRLVGVKQRTQAWWEGFHAARFEKMPQRPEKGDFSTLLKYRQAMLWCPLLKDGLCGAYNQRPMNCRTHMVSGAASACESDAERPSQIYAMVGSDDFHLRAIYLLGNESPAHLYEWDHLGIWLGKLLLGLETSTQAAHSHLVHFE